MILVSDSATPSSIVNQSGLLDVEGSTKYHKPFISFFYPFFLHLLCLCRVFLPLFLTLFLCLFPAPFSRHFSVSSTSFSRFLFIFPASFAIRFFVFYLRAFCSFFLHILYAIPRSPCTSCDFSTSFLHFVCQLFVSSHLSCLSSVFRHCCTNLLCVFYVFPVTLFRLFPPLLSLSLRPF